jgi:LacI family transcriptional regulator
MVSIKDVAAKAGVSISTVSNVINGTRHVSDELKLQVNQAITGLNYEVDTLARSLKSKKTRSIGVVITNINRIFFSEVIKGIQATALSKGYMLALCHTSDNFEIEKRCIKMFEDNWLDGIIVASVADQEQHDYFRHLKNLGNSKKKIPIVSLERNLEQYSIPSVAVDNYQGGYMATSHLIELECRSIAHITGPLNSCMVQDRLKGYKDALVSAGMQVDEGLIMHGDFSPVCGYMLTKELLRKGIEFDGLFAANDQMAIGTIKALKEEGVKIPEDVKVIGFDNTFVSTLVEPSLTTVNVPKYKLGVTAMEILLRQMEHNDDLNNFNEIPINLIVRQSTDLHGEKNWDMYGW